MHNSQAQSHQHPAESSAADMLALGRRQSSEGQIKLPHPEALRNVGTVSDCSGLSQASSRRNPSTRGAKVMYNKFYKEKGFLPPLVQSTGKLQNQTGTARTPRNFSRSHSQLSCTSHPSQEGTVMDGSILQLDHSPRESPHTVREQVVQLPDPHCNTNVHSRKRQNELLEKRNNFEYKTLDSQPKMVRSSEDVFFEEG